MKKKMTKKLLPKLVATIKSHMGGVDSIPLSEVLDEFKEWEISAVIIGLAVVEAGYCMTYRDGGYLILR